MQLTNEIACYITNCIRIKICSVQTQSQIQQNNILSINSVIGPVVYWQWLVCSCQV